MFVFEPIGGAEALNQGKVAYNVYVDAKGWIPAHVVNRAIPQALAIVQELQEEFDRGDEIDEQNRNKLAAFMNDVTQVYGEDELEAIARVEARMEAEEKTEGGWRSIPSSDYLTEMWIQKSHSLLKGSTVLKATAVVDATPAELAVWETDKLNRCVERCPPPTAQAKRAQKRASGSGGGPKRLNLFALAALASLAPK
jgi:hypothetical protein